MKPIYTLIILAGVVFFVSSCSKNLDLVPDNFIKEADALKDVPSLERGIIGAYATFNGTYDDQINAATLYADEAFLPSSNNVGIGVVLHKWQHNAGTTDVTDAWYSFYAGVDRANRIIAAGDTITPKSDEEEAQLNKIIGEAYALRAFGHLQLLINYADGYESDAPAVPYMKASVISTPKRNTVIEVLTNVLDDLGVAETLVPSSFNDKARITLAAVYAIKARAALYLKDWPTAIDAATKAINAVPIATKAQYPLIWKDSSDAEIIWKHKRTQGQARIGDYFFYRRSNASLFGVSSKLRETFTPNDIRFSSLTYSASEPERLAKYQGGDPNEILRADVKVFRTSEMYLIRAEAYISGTVANIPAATADLKALFLNRLTGFTDTSFSTRGTVLTAVYNERFKELAFECQRLFDLRRRTLPINRGLGDVSLASGAVNMLPTDKKYYFPIPTGEIQANKFMEQNTGYKN